MTKNSKKKSTSPYQNLLDHSADTLSLLWEYGLTQLGHTPDAAKKAFTSVINDLHKAEKKVVKSKKLKSKKTAVKKAAKSVKKP